MFFDCECDCEKHTVVTHRLSTLIHEKSKSCGCIKFNNPNIIEDLTGQKFGRLTVIGRDIERDKKIIKTVKIEHIGYANVTVVILSWLVLLDIN